MSSGDIEWGITPYNTKGFWHKVVAHPNQSEAIAWIEASLGVTLTDWQKVLVAKAFGRTPHMRPSKPLCESTKQTLSPHGLVRCGKAEGHNDRHSAIHGSQHFSWPNRKPECGDEFSLSDVLSINEVVSCDLAPEHKGRHSFREHIVWGEPAQAEPVWPEGVPSEVYLIVHEGREGVELATNEDRAIIDADRYRGLKAHIYRVTSMAVEELSIQRHIIRQALVPKGTEVEQ